MKTQSIPVPPAAVEALRRTVDGLVAYPTDPAYDVVAVGHLDPGLRPDVLVVPASEGAVRAVVDVARSHGLHLLRRGTDRGPSTVADDRPTLLVLTHRLDGVLVDTAELTATVGPGASWCSLVRHARAAGLGVTPPDHAATVLDSIFAGTTDVLSAHIVRSDGFVHVVDAPQPPPGQHGAWIVTAVVVRLHPVPAPPDQPHHHRKDPVMTSAPTEPLLLPGQAAAPPGPCDMTGMYVMHHAFRRDVTRFAAAARSTPVPASRTWEALLTRWDLFARELHHHHTKEDEGIWPLLLDRVDAPDRVVLDAMENEHDAIDPLLTRVRDGLQAMASGEPDRRTEATRADLVDAVAAFAELLDAHLAHEEVDAIRLIQEHITAREWEHLEATVLRGKPSPGQMLLMLPWVTDELPRAGLDRLLSGAPAPVR